ncbi:hypothetical protein, partial [Helicobacter pullorum]|uniref:hypothetical protein n=2 Tax=Helicobacter pullorum TaxID=35818 RepID=UPI001C53BBFC
GYDMKNENVEILKEVYIALDKVEGAKVVLRSIENTLNCMEYLLENVKEEKYSNICGLFEFEGDVVDKDYLLYDLNDKLEESIRGIEEVFETLPLLTRSRKIRVME